MSFVIIEFEMIVAVPPPLLPLLLENKKLKFGGEVSVRTAGASVLSHVSVKNKQSRLFCKIRSLMIKDSFDREWTLKSAMWRAACGLVDCETLLMLTYFRL